MDSSRESERRAAQEELRASQGAEGIDKTNRLLEALVHAVLAISAPTEEQLRQQGASQELDEKFERGWL
ncbi:hypothetical protein [Streptomyces luteogriseus]|uniref:hypothetical protein n=1 Tax=Streptomyces luteogriseus TaxID=68233 RepID=UPI0037B6E181